MTHPLDLQEGDPVRVTLPANGRRAGLVEATEAVEASRPKVDK